MGYHPAIKNNIEGGNLMKKSLHLVLLTAMLLFLFSGQSWVAQATSNVEERNYLIKFDPKNGEAVQELTVKSGEQLTEDQVPFANIQNGEKDFLGWFYGSGNKHDLIFPFTPDKDLVLKAKWGKHTAPNAVEKPGYRMIFNDEFDNMDGKLNPDLWVDKYLSSWTRQPELANPVYELKDGVMSLQIKEDTQPWAPEYDGQTVVSGFTTGNRNGLHNWTKTNEVRNPVETELSHINKYGYYEMRAKTQAGSSRHAAWWLVGFEDEVSHAAEIDIFEVLGRDPHGVPRAFHGWNDDKAFENLDHGNHHNGGSTVDFHNEWHVYGMDWQEGTGSGAFPDKLVFYIDGVEVGSKHTNITYPMIQLFSLYEKRAGGWTGPWEPMPYPNSFDIDYVRVYKELPTGQSEIPTDQLKITDIGQSTVSVTEGKAELKTIISQVIGEEGTVYTEPNLPNTHSYVDVTWNDGVVTQEFVKWDPITEKDLERINRGEAVKKKGVLPNLMGTPGLAATTLNVDIVQAPPYASENLGTTNNQGELAKLFDGDLTGNSGEFKFTSNKLPADKEVNIQYNFKEVVNLNSIAFTTNYGHDQGIKKFKIAAWDENLKEWVRFEEEYTLAWTPEGKTELGETLSVTLNGIETSKVKIILTDAGLTWGNKIAMRQIGFDYTVKEPVEIPEEVQEELDELAALISEAKAISNANGKYTAASFETLQKAIKLAEEAWATVRIEDEIEDAIDALEDTIDQLIESKDWEDDLAELTELIEEATAISNTNGKYTTASYETLQTAIEVAKEAFVTVRTEDELEAAIDALEDAIDGLVKNKGEVSTATILTLIHDLEKRGAFKDAEVVKSLQLHLTAVAQFEKQEASAKVIKHMKGFQKLVEYQHDKKLISQEGYKALKESSKALIKKWE